MKRKYKRLCIMKILILLILLLNNKEVLAKSNKDTTIIEADKITSKSKNSEISASGNVIFIRDKYTISADKVTYDKIKKRIYLEKRTKFIDTENNKIVADTAELSDDVKTGSFTDASIILNNGLSIVSPTVKKINDDRYESFNSDYYFCPNENLDINLNYEEIVKEIKRGSNNLQIFSLYSKETTIDKEKEKIYLKHVFLKFFDIPIFYLPYLVTERPFNNRISGLSMPSFSKNRNYGYAVSVPIDLYFFDNIDINTETTIYQNLNFLSDIKFKYFKNDFLIMLNLDYAFDNKQSKDIKNNINISEQNEGVYRNHRLYGNLTSRAIIKKNLFFRTQIKLSIDPYIIRDYFDNYSEFLQSDANLFKINKNDNINIDMVAFQHIREQRRKLIIQKTPIFVPSIYYHYINNDLHGYLDFGIKANTNLSINKFNKNYNKMLFEPNISYRNIFGKLFIKSNLLLHTDIYNQNYNNKENDFIYRIYPELELKASYPFIILNKIITKPIVQIFVGQKKNLNFIDIDSRNSELTINNLFSNNRYSGYDLMENGTRVNYGIINEIPYKYGRFKLTLGQGYKNSIDNTYRIRCFYDNFSDILTGIGFNYKNILNINYLNNIDHITYKKNREEFILNGSFYKFYYSASYVYVKNFINKRIREQKQAHFAIGYSITKKIKMNININTDLIENKIIYYGGSLFYEDNCYTTGFNISKQSLINSYNDDNFTINFNFRLKGIRIWS